MHPRPWQNNANRGAHSYGGRSISVLQEQFDCLGSAESALPSILFQKETILSELLEFRIIQIATQILTTFSWDTKIKGFFPLQFSHGKR